MARRAHLVLIFCFLLVADRSFGQSVRGTILGTVTDSSGAVIKGAHVTAADGYRPDASGCDERHG